MNSNHDCISQAHNNFIINGFDQKIYIIIFFQTCIYYVQRLQRKEFSFTGLPHKVWSHRLHFEH